MNDERGTNSERGSRSTRRTFLAATSVTVGAAAGCTDSESGDDANVVDPQRMDDEDEADEDEADGSDEDESAGSSDDAGSETEDETDDESTDDPGADDESATDDADEDETDDDEADDEDDESESAQEGDDSADDDSGEEPADGTESDDADDSSAADDETPTDADEADDTGADDEGVDGEEEVDDDTGDSDADEADDDADETDDNADEDETDDDEADDEDDEDEADEDDEDETDEDDDGDEAGDRTDLDHPSAANMAHSPVLGPEPTDGEATVIMFDDPSCPACAYFEATTFPDLRDHAEAGELSLVWRGMAVIEEWSGAALQVLWATYERDVDAFWELREHTFEIQDEIDGDEEAIDRLTDRLSSTTSLDVDAIRADAENATYEERPTLDEDAGAQAEIDATPYFFLFRDGEFRTEIRGVEDYRVFASALEL